MTGLKPLIRMTLGVRFEMKHYVLAVGKQEWNSFA